MRLGHAVHCGGVGVLELSRHDTYAPCDALKVTD
jgi:hypothetical protein